MRRTTSKEDLEGAAAVSVTGGSIMNKKEKSGTFPLIVKLVLCVFFIIVCFTLLSGFHIDSLMSASSSTSVAGGDRREHRKFVGDWSTGQAAKLIETVNADEAKEGASARADVPVPLVTLESAATATDDLRTILMFTSISPSRSWDHPKY